MSTTPAATTPLTDEQVAKHCKFNQPFQHIAPFAVGNVLQGAAQAVPLHFNEVTIPLHFNEVTITAAGVEPMVPASFARTLERALSSAQSELARVRLIAHQALDCAGALTNYTEERPELHRIEKQIHQLNIQLAAAPASDTQGSGG